MEAKVLLEGCFPPIPTPFDAKGRVDHDNLALNLEKWQKTPLRGFLVLGSFEQAAVMFVNIMPLLAVK